MGQGMSLKSEMKKNHDLNHDLIFYAHTINCVCHSIRSMFRVLLPNSLISNMYQLSLMQDMKQIVENKQATVGIMCMVKSNIWFFNV